MGHHSHRSRRERDDDDIDRRSSHRDRDDHHHRRRHRSRSRSPSRRHRDKDDDGARASSSSRHHSSSSRRDDRDSHRSSGSSRHRHRDDDRDRDRDHSSRHSSKRHRRNDDANDVEQRPRILDDDAEAAPPTPPSDSVVAGHDASESIPTSASLDLQSRPAPSYQDDPAPLPASAPTATQIQRDDWMLDRPAAEDPGPGATSTSSADASTSAAPASSGDYDFFSSLGQTRSKPPPPSKPDPEQLHISSRELNQQLVQGKALDEYATEAKKETKYGAPGYQWRMMKLRKTYEQAEEEGRQVEEVAMERYGDREGFEEAKREKEFLDGKQGKGAKAGGAMDQAKRPALSPRASSTAAGTPMSSRSSSFRKPGEATPLAGGTPGPSSSRPTGAAERAMSNLGRSSAAGTPQSQPSTPIPSVLAPPPRPQQPASTTTTSSTTATASDAPQQAQPILDAAALNKLEAKVLKAELSGKPNAASLREKLEREKARAAQGPAAGSGSGSDYFAGATTSGVSSTRSDEPQVQMLPTLDAHGRLYDVGTSRAGEAAPAPPLPGNRRTARKKEKHVETHDPLTGEFVRYNKDDDTQTLSELVRQEKFKAGRGDQKDFDAELASHIASDGAYREGLDYLDDNAERLARKKMKSDALKRQFAVDDYAKTRRALESCRFCYRGEESEFPPLTEGTIIARGTRAYLALPETEPLVEGHCLIVPTQHHLASLEADEDTWEEVKNFAKCLLQMVAAANTAPGGGEEQTYIFWETVTTLKAQRHTYIEAIPLPRSLVQAELPATFRSELLQSGSEWDASSSKLITFSPERPFRRSMVAQLPYFAVLFDHKGEKGYGHVIEGPDAGDVLEAAGKGGDDDGYGVDELGSKGGGSGAKFEKWFAAEVVGNVLDLEPRQWRRPKRLGEGEKRRLREEFGRRWGPFDWTRMLREGETKNGGGEA